MISAQDVIWFPLNRSTRVRLWPGTEPSVEKGSVQSVCFAGVPRGRGAEVLGPADIVASSFSWIWQMTSWFSRIQHHRWQHSQFWSRQSGYGVQELPGSLSTHFNEKPGGKIIMVCIQNDYKQNQSHWVLKGKVLEQMKELNKGPRLKTTIFFKKTKFFFSSAIVK